MLFTTMRANCTVASFPRCTITGRYPDRVGVSGVIRTKPEDSWDIWPSIPTGKTHYKPLATTRPLLESGTSGWSLRILPMNAVRFFSWLSRGHDGTATRNHLRHGINYMRRNQEAIELRAMPPTSSANGLAIIFESVRRGPTSLSFCIWPLMLPTSYRANDGMVGQS